jgi:ferritin-like metal-binding protein YciE
MSIDSLEEMFEQELEQLYYIENRLVDALEEMASEASNEKLQSGFAEHREETREQVERLERAFDAFGREPSESESQVLDGLLREHDEFVEQSGDEQLHDLYDLQAGMKTERFEITAYEGLLTLANKLDLGDDVTDPLEDNLSEEKSALRELEGLSKGSKLKGMLDQVTG